MSDSTLKFKEGQRIRFTDGKVNTTGVVTAATTLKTRVRIGGLDVSPKAVSTYNYRVLLDNDGWDREAAEDQVTALNE